MKLLNPDFSLEDFFDSLKESKESLLLLDYDGTLSPFTPDRNNAKPYNGIKNRLELLIGCKSTDVIIISGRDIKMLKRLLNLRDYPELWGCHGAERFDIKKGYQVSIDKNVLKGLRHLKDWVYDNGLEKYSEFKPVGCAFHWRDLSSDIAKQIRSTVKNYWVANAAQFGLELHKFDGGIELRPQNINKGTVIKEILHRIQSKIPIAYLGDDLTDEEAFEILGSRGLKVLVRKVPRKSSADIHIIPPEELLLFLDKWIKHSQ